MPVSSLLGKTILRAEHIDDEVKFITSDGKIFFLGHSRIGTETVLLDKISGSLQDICEEPIIEATCEASPPRKLALVATQWTFFKIATMQGLVTISFFGETFGKEPLGVDLMEEGGFAR